MHDGHDGDDDDGYPNEISKGKILYSGIGAENPERAEYALEEGVPALMEEGILTRRRFIATTVAAAFCAGVVGSVVASWVIVAGQPEGKSKGNKASEPRPELSEQQKLWIAGARALADAKLEKLVAQYEPLVAVIELYGGDEMLWVGARRLATYALLKRDAEGVAIARRLLQTFEFRPPPAELQRLVPQLKELARQRRH